MLVFVCYDRLPPDWHRQCHVTFFKFCRNHIFEIGKAVLFCFLAVLDPKVGHTMDVLSPFISVLCHYSAEAMLPLNIGFTLRRDLAVFSRSAITPPKVKRFG